jgi:hypothetical protein
VGIFIDRLTNHGLFCPASIRVIEKLTFVLRVTGATKEQNGYHPDSLTLSIPSIVQHGAIQCQIPKDIERKIDRPINSW